MKVLWNYNSGMKIFLSPVLIDGTLILQMWDGQVTCLSIDSGQARYTFRLADRCSCVTRIDNGLLFVPLTGEATLYSPACDEITGYTVVQDGFYRVDKVEVFESLLLGAERKGDPYKMPENSPVLFAMDEKLSRISSCTAPEWVWLAKVMPGLGVFCINTDKTRLVLMTPRNDWQAIPWRLPDGGYRAAYYAQERLYIVGQNETIAVQDVHTQETIHTYQGVDGMGLIAKDCCYLLSFGRISMYDLDLRVVRAEYDCNIRGLDSSIQAGVCEVGPEMVCFGSNNCHLWCFNRHTGELLEKIEHPDFVVGAPIFDGERLYVECIDGTITCYDATPYAS